MQQAQATLESGKELLECHERGIKKGAGVFRLQRRCAADQASRAPNMLLPSDISSSFVGSLSVDARAIVRGSATLAADLAGIWERAVRAWPGVELAPELFFAFVARRVDGDAVATLGTLRGDDLYLLCAYLEGSSGAAALFEAHYLVPAKRAVRRLRAGDDEVAEIIQRLRCRLLLDRAVDPGRRHYVGSGSLVSWLCVCAVREVWHQRRRDRRTSGFREGALEELPCKDEDNELAYLKQLYRGEFKAAFQEALASLSTKQRNILRYHVCEGLNIAAIGAIYGVHRATVARWIARAREELRERTRDGLVRRVGIERDKFDSIIRLINSQMDMSLQLRLE